MLSTPQIQAVLERVQYRPRWLIAAYDGMWEGQHIQIYAEVPDAYRPELTTVIDVHSPLPPQADEQSFLIWLMDRLIRIESHEAREFFTVDGQRPFDPHAESADRDLPPGVEPLQPENAHRK